ncbi:unnamed protein product [Pedinophyceae sp. YPF-701]|nr:unnamed protein product [Pedinophyceae sp. YPF-701]
MGLLRPVASALATLSGRRRARGARCGEEGRGVAAQDEPERQSSFDRESGTSTTSTDASSGEALASGGEARQSEISLRDLPARGQRGSEEDTEAAKFQTKNSDCLRSPQLEFTEQNARASHRRKASSSSYCCATATVPSSPAAATPPLHSPAAAKALPSTEQEPDDAPARARSGAATQKPLRRSLESAVGQPRPAQLETRDVELVARMIESVAKGERMSRAVACLTRMSVLNPAAIASAKAPGRTTLLHAAAVTPAPGHGALLSVLAVAAGVDPAARNEQGRTALMLAAARGSTAVLRTAIESASSPSDIVMVRDVRGRTALHYAAEGLHAVAIAVLRAAGHPTTVLDVRGVSAQDLLRQAGLRADSIDEHKRVWECILALDYGA